MSWIKITHELSDKPEVWKMAAALQRTPEEIVGRLVRVWIWADQQLIDGNAVSVTNVTLDAVTRCAGFAEAMREVGWLTGDEGNLEFPNFTRHNGKSAKKRALASERQRSMRDKSVTEVTQTSRSEAGYLTTREEKRREVTASAPPGAQALAVTSSKPPEVLTGADPAPQQDGPFGALEARGPVAAIGVPQNPKPVVPVESDRAERDRTWQEGKALAAPHLADLRKIVGKRKVAVTPREPGEDGD